MLAQHLQCLNALPLSTLLRELQAAKTAALYPDRGTGELPARYTQQGLGSDHLPQFPCPACSQTGASPDPIPLTQDWILSPPLTPTVRTQMPPPPHPSQTHSPTLEGGMFKNKYLFGQSASRSREGRGVPKVT